jgi:hypothetical protein
VELCEPPAIATTRQSEITPHIDPVKLHAFHVEHSIDVADLLIPSQLHLLWGWFAEQAQAYKASTHIQNKTAYLGAVTLLAAVALLRRQGGFWLASALVFIVLALGPQVRFFGTIHRSAPAHSAAFPWLTAPVQPGARQYQGKCRICSGYRMCCGK